LLQHTKKGLPLPLAQGSVKKLKKILEEKQKR
jgi:hypothetical protein